MKVAVMGSGLLLGVLVSCAHLQPQQTWIARLPTGERWQQHVKRELMPFWTRPEALGTPLGAFPTVRCDDGALLNRSKPCAELNEDWLLEERLSVVALSRQIYVYAAAFHLTGEPRYLESARAGVEYLRTHLLDRRHGGAYSWQDTRTGAGGPEPAERTAQEQAYAQLGLSLYYYLTRDEAVLQDLLANKDSIFKQHGDGRTRPLRRKPSSLDTEPVNVVDTLDQLNAYMVLLTPMLPEPRRGQWAEEMRVLAHQLVKGFYSPEDNLFLLQVGKPEDKRLGRAPNDLGHSIKSLWMIRSVGLLTGDKALIELAEQRGPAMLERAYLPQWGTWGSKVKEDGGVETVQDWWIHAELDQFAASVALSHPTVGARLPSTYDFWFRRFVDPTWGEVWSQVDVTTGQKLTDLPKQWPWKNGFHTLEHALVGYITSQQLRGEPVVLYYAHDPAKVDNPPRPYVYRGEVTQVEPQGGSVYRVTFRDVR